MDEDGLSCRHKLQLQSRVIGMLSGLLACGCTCEHKGPQGTRCSDICSRVLRKKVAQNAAGTRQSTPNSDCLASLQWWPNRLGSLCGGITRQTRCIRPEP
eukprot:1159228-Pelagomonas_calceolata.AAC.9